jgi:hypothetical protein
MPNATRVNGTRQTEALPEPPAGLSEASANIWRMFVGRCRSAGRRVMLEQALRALDRAEQAAELVRRDGLVKTTASTGAVHVHPAAKIERESRQLFVKIFADHLRLDFQRSTDGILHNDD